jgi:hypothetical protein
MLLSLLSVAWADPPVAEPAPVAPARPEVYAPRTEIEFDPLTLAGQKLGPGMVLVGGRPRAVFPPFFELRRSWDRELLWSTDEIE